MAGTATHYDSTEIIVNTPAQIWAGLPVPSPGGRITLAVDGTPDATANPSAIHLGLTKEGVKANIVSSIDKYYADEIAEPVAASVNVTDATFEGNFLQLLNDNVLKKLTAPFGTYGSGSGYKEFALGRKTLSYESVALIFPDPLDGTKFHVLHLYNAINEAGLALAFMRKGMTEAPFKFVGYGIASRAATDTLGKYWWQV